ncbi:MAG: hypothetical protein FD171_1963 [Actinobacteria bacterium]|nr:MAG: hypothetical protein FD171_1963 [Actinomycetota bacterium]MDO8950438.1 SIMPL domain-containing protein [Actinomycetota bacterium]
MARNRTLATLAVILLTITVGLAGCAAQVAKEPTPGVPNTVTASGEGKELAAPDQAEMSFGVSVQGTDAKKTLADAGKKAETIIAALKKAGVDAKDIQTSGVNLYPQQDYYPGKAPRITGYQASVQVRTTIKDIAKVGDVITAGTNAGANEINGPSFTLSEKSTSRAAAIEKAVADARARADAMAKAAGKSVGEVLSISEAGVNVPPVNWGLSRGAQSYALDAAAAVPIEKGTLDITANVTVIFELK